jgi:hypothetical protein
MNLSFASMKKLQKFLTKSLSAQVSLPTFQLKLNMINSLQFKIMLKITYNNEASINLFSICNLDYSRISLMSILKKKHFITLT